MLADVTVGAFLSGGVDSSAIVASMARHATAPVKAFTMGFPGTSIDETEAASRIARHLGCEHITLPLRPQDAGIMLPEVQRSHDEPCAATAAVPVWHLSKLAAEHVKRSEEHTSELQSLMRISYAVFCLKKKKKTSREHKTT